MIFLQAAKHVVFERDSQHPDGLPQEFEPST